MATNTYILLRDSAGFERRFRVPMGTLEPRIQKLQTNERTVTGRADTQEGPHIALHALQVRVRNAASDPDDEPGLPAWGTLANLRHYFGLKNPRGNPHNRLTYVDHLGASHAVKLTGELGQTNVTHVLDGSESWFYVALAMEAVEPV